MHDKRLFEYAVLRVVPRVEREEFVNVGVVLYSSASRFLQVKFSLNAKKILACCEAVDLEELESRLMAFHRICPGDQKAGPIAKLPAASRFRWLTATKSTVLQSSAVHPGFCLDPAEELEKLFDKLVA